MPGTLYPARCTLLDVPIPVYTLMYVITLLTASFAPGAHVGHLKAPS
jgi:hypothetical protein